MTPGSRDRVRLRRAVPGYARGSADLVVFPAGAEAMVADAPAGAGHLRLQVLDPGGCEPAGVACARPSELELLERCLAPIFED